MHNLDEKYCPQQLFNEKRINEENNQYKQYRIRIRLL
jgi:hypothetical protein